MNSVTFLHRPILYQQFYTHKNYKRYIGQRTWAGIAQKFLALTNLGVLLESEVVILEWEPGRVRPGRIRTSV